MRPAPSPAAVSRDAGGGSEPGCSVALAGLHRLAVALARDPDVVVFSRRLVSTSPSRGRVARLAALFTFVGALMEHGLSSAPRGRERHRNGVDALLFVLGYERGPAVVLAAMLMALGERARLECTREMAFVQVELEPADLSLLPPFARVQMRHGRCFLSLDPRRARSPFGFLPLPVRDALARRRGLAALAAGARIPA